MSNIGKFVNLICGVFFIYKGYSIYFDPRFCSSYLSYCDDLSAYHKPLGILLGGLGLAFAVLNLRSLLQGKEVDYICPTCQQVCSAKDARSGNCPQCSVPLEPLEGFYKRHPELKDKKEQPNC